MALVTIVKKTQLAFPLILAPERYDPRRQINANDTETVELNELVVSVKRTVNSSKELGNCLILDTSDAREGIVICRKRPVPGTSIGSTKKVLALNDVIISRLRPYLRQVAYIDSEIPLSQDANILCSTEFFILRSCNEESIAFLVPFLLSRKVQEVLAASQEGGHHPRFNESTLLKLPIPKHLLSERKRISEAMIDGIKSYRRSQRIVDCTIAEVESTLAY